MHSYPRRITDDEVEPTSGGDISEMGVEREGKRTSFAQHSQLVSGIAETAAGSREPKTRLSIRLVPRAEQISASRGDQELHPFGGEPRFRAHLNFDRRGSLCPVQRACEVELPATGSSHVSDAEAFYNETATTERAVMERITGQRVA